MKLSDLGEKKVLESLRALLPVGDDAYALPYAGKYLILSCDMIYGPTHVPDEMSWAQLGRLVVSVNFSDVAAMGAKPIAFLQSFGGPDMEAEDFMELVSAADEMCKKYGASYVGGDLNETGELVLAGTALGETDRPVYKKGAREGDVVAVTGSFGGAALGVEVLLKGLSDDWDSPDFRRVVGYALEPVARVSEGFFLRDYASSMTDASDSLAVSLNDLARDSGVRITVDSAEIPCPPEARRVAESVNLDLTDMALFGGGDYELVFTVKQDDWAVVKKRIGATEIGCAESGSGVFLDAKRLPAKGFEHYRKH